MSGALICQTDLFILRHWQIMGIEQSGYSLECVATAFGARKPVCLSGVRITQCLPHQNPLTMQIAGMLPLTWRNRRYLGDDMALNANSKFEFAFFSAL